MERRGPTSDSPHRSNSPRTSSPAASHFPSGLMVASSGTSTIVRISSPVVRLQTTARPGETPEQTQARATKEFAAMLGSPMLDVWSTAAIDEILSLLYERATVGSLAK